MNTPSLSQLYQRAKNTGIGAVNIPWCGKRIVFNEDFKSIDKKSNKNLQSIKKDLKKLQKKTIKSLEIKNEKLRFMCEYAMHWVTSDDKNEDELGRYMKNNCISVYNSPKLVSKSLKKKIKVLEKENKKLKQFYKYHISKIDFDYQQEVNYLEIYDELIDYL